MNWETSLEISEELEQRIAFGGDLRKAYFGATGFREHLEKALLMGRRYTEEHYPTTWAERLLQALWGTFACVQPEINRIDTLLDIGRNGTRVKIRIDMWKLDGDNPPFKLAALEAMFDQTGEIETFASERDVTVDL